MPTLVKLLVLLIATWACLRLTALAIRRASRKGVLTAHRFALFLVVGVMSQYVVLVSVALVYAGPVQVTPLLIWVAVGSVALTVAGGYPMALLMYTGIFKKILGDDARENNEQD